MTSPNKKAIISAISNLGDILILLEQLLRKANLSSIIREFDNVILASENASFSPRKLLFVPSLEELSGKNSRIHEILKKLDIERFDVAYIISLNRKEISDYYKRNIQAQFLSLRFEYWNLNDLIEKIDTHFPEYWGHTDTFIKPYEDLFISEVEEDNELKCLKLDKKYIDMLDIFIEPRISIIISDEKDSSIVFTRSFNREKIVASGNYILTGDAGTGKSTLQKKIGKEIVIRNAARDKKTLPILIRQLDIVANSDSIEKAIDSQLLKAFTDFDLKKVFRDYELLILIDSIDEFSKDKKAKILADIQRLSTDFDLRYVISTRDDHYLLDGLEVKKEFDRVRIENFNLNQAKEFLEHFFCFDFDKSGKLLESLRSNKILEKLAVTPLTLSLISILFEEKHYEIPATITDIYDSFKIILLGRSTVNSSLDFLDITIKERILSLYALSILQTKERRPKAVNEFEVFVTDFLKSKSSSYDEKAIPDILKYFIKDIDLLFVEDNQYVKFKHDSFMEYFAALEIFNQKRELQSELVNRFTELNWQNTSIFYAGRSKDMPEFLKQITSKIASYDRLVDVFIASSGFGYLLQALYLTDESIRKDAIKIATHLNLKLFEKIKIFASEETNFFSGLTLPQVASLSTIYFLFSYDSLTLKGAISMAFDELMEQYLDFDSQNDLRAHSVAYQMFNLAVTLNSEKINDPSKLSQLFEAKNILNIPIMVLLFERVLDFVNPSFVKNQREKKKIRERMIKNIENVNYYIKTPIKELRYTKFDNINSLKNVKIFTEGETDSVIINTAYNVLTGDTPYWEIRQCGNASTGGAQTLSKMLSTIPPPSPEDVIIGLFDNDSKGIQEFESLKETFFEKINYRTKKHKNFAIYALLIPIPPDKNQYSQEKNEFMFFEIEHYFPQFFLEEHNMVKSTPISGVFEIKEKKARFAKVVRKQRDISIFEDFKCLFQSIDDICKQKSDFLN